MTRLPSDDRNVFGVPYSEEHPKYRVGPLCSVPSCSRLADHSHHAWRRSFVAGDYGWVELPDGRVIQNLVALCWRHHQDITENRTRIYWNGSALEWIDESNGTASAGGFFLDPQPKIWSTTSTTPEEPKEQHVHAPGSGETCPTCHRSVPIKRDKTDKKEAKRARASWTITVPKDQRENGAEVLDVLLEEAAKITGHDQENDKTKYHTLAFALGMFVMHAEELAGDAY